MESAGTFRITRAGQMTVPNVVRDKLGLREGTSIDVYYSGDLMVVRRKRAPLEAFDELAAAAEKRFKERGVTRKDVKDAVKSARNEMRG